MLQFNELKITADNKCLIIDVQVEDLPYFNKVKIDSVLMDTQDTWLSSGPSDKAVVLYSQDNTALDTLGDNSGRHIRLEIEKPLISPADNNMYIIYAVADTSSAPEALEAPCDCSQDTVVKVVVNLHILYNYLMKGIREIENDCSLPVNFINSFLQEQAVEACLRTGNYAQAVKYWKKFFMGKPLTVTSKQCGCHG